MKKSVLTFLLAICFHTAMAIDLTKATIVYQKGDAPLVTTASARRLSMTTSIPWVCAACTMRP